MQKPTINSETKYKFLSSRSIITMLLIILLNSVPAQADMSCGDNPFYCLIKLPSAAIRWLSDRKGNQNYEENEKKNQEILTNEIQPILEKRIRIKENVTRLLQGREKAFLNQVHAEKGELLDQIVNALECQSGPFKKLLKEKSELLKPGATAKFKIKNSQLVLPENIAEYENLMENMSWVLPNNSPDELERRQFENKAFESTKLYLMEGYAFRRKGGWAAETLVSLFIINNFTVSNESPLCQVKVYNGLNIQNYFYECQPQRLIYKPFLCENFIGSPGQNYSEQ